MFVLIGGGEIGRPNCPYETEAIDRTIIGLIPQKAKLMFIGWAQVPYGIPNEVLYYQCIEKIYCKKFKCDVDIFSYDDLNKGRNLDELESADIVYISGGDTCFLKDAFSKYNVFSYLKKAHSLGKVIVGSSAGANILCSNSLSAMDYKRNISTKPLCIEGLGCLNGWVFSPHFSTDKIRQIHMVEYLKASASSGLLGLGLDDCCALLFDGITIQTVSSRLEACAHICWYSGNVYNKKSVFFPSPVPIETIRYQYEPKV